ncbi:MAG: SpoIIE family protein phosphatase [Streptosporangiales bacterium]
MRELLTSLPAAVAHLSGPDLIIDFANEACFRLTGDRDLLGRPLAEAFPELADRMDILHQIMKTGETVRGSEAGVRFSRKEHDRRLFLDYVCQPVRDGDGEVAGILLYATDVTAHIQGRVELEETAAQLAVTEERLRGLFETMPQGVVHYAADGSVLGANPAARRILGLSESEMTNWPLANVRRAVHEDGSPFRPEELPLSRALRSREIVPDMIIGVPHGRTGEIRWHRVTAVPEARDEAGRPQRAYVMFTDLTEQRRVEAALRESNALLGRLREANALGVIVSSVQRIHEANDFFLDLIGYTQEDLETGRLSYQSITPPEYAGGDAAAVAQLRRTGVVPSLEKEYIHRDGHRIPVLIGGAVIDPDPLRWVTFVVDLTARQRAERERAELLVRERATKAEADRARERLTFLLHAGEMVAATDDRQQMLEHAAHLVVPTLADHCVVYLPAADGTLHATSLAHDDPARASVLAEFRRHKIPPVGPMSIQLAYSTGTSQLLRDAKAQLPRWHDLAPDLAELLVRLRADCVLSTPLLVDERPVGVLALARDADRPGFTDTDIAVVEEFARRLAHGLATADTFVREHAIAETLQRSVLPGALPSIGRLDLAVCYLPATEGADVGGDWYDAFPLEDGRVGLVIGDVTGHNIGSASIMGQVRSMLRAYAIDYPHPGEVLERTNTALHRLLPEALATAVYAVLDPSTGELVYANAGHLPPLVATGAGAVDYLDEATGSMLGASPDATYTAGRRLLPAGGVLLNYTDGLIENGRRDLTDGLDALAVVMRWSPARTAEETCAAVRDCLLGTDIRDDDVCLLVARLQG